MNAVFDEKTDNVKTQPTLSQRVGYVLVQMGDELEALILDYQKQHIDNMDNVSSDLIADMDKQNITRLALLTDSDAKTVEQDIGIAIQVIGWLHFPDLVTKPQPERQQGMKPETIEAFKKLIGCMNTGIDGLEYQRKIREEAW
jgi:hypothetical protein